MRSGITDQQVQRTIEKILERTAYHRGCALWLGAQSRGGQRKSLKSTYGSIAIADRGPVVRAHVFVAFAFGIIDDLRLPPGLQLDHTCERSLCLNPGHLELVTSTVNLERRWRRDIKHDRCQLELIQLYRREVISIMVEAPKWLKYEDHILEAGWRDGLSLSQIAAKLPGRTRSSVAGRRMRLGLARRPSPFERARS